MSLPGSPPRSLSSAAFLEPGFSCSSPKKAMGRPVVDRHPFTVLSKNQHNIHRSYSNQFHSSSLYDPLLDGSATTSPVLCEEIPVISLDDVEEEEMSKCGLVGNLENNGQLGIVLVHGFGGGVFSWRHVMGVLARQTGCKVAAYDRPGWGLTSRLRAEDWEEKELSNPYKLEIQVINHAIPFFFFPIPFLDRAVACDFGTLHASFWYSCRVTACDLALFILFSVLLLSAKERSTIEVYYLTSL